MRTTLFYLLGISFLALYSRIILFYLAEISLLLSLVATSLLFGLLFYLWRKSTPAIILGSLLLLVAFFSTKMAVRDIVQEKQCFIFNQSYPGTATYDQCISTLSLGDYLKGIFS